MQAVFGLIPNQRTWAINHVGVYLFTPVGRQAMQEFRAALGKAHQLISDRIGVELSQTLSAVFVAHGDKGVGDHNIGASNSFFGSVIKIDTALELTGNLDILFVWREAIRRPDREGESKFRRSMQETGTDIVAISHPGETRALQINAAFFQRHQIRHDLARMRAIGQAIDDRHRGGFSKHFQVAVIVGPQHDHIDIAAEHARGVFDRLAAAKLHV
mmetsp:Transcript_33215/g.42814  ORF Transcript_33215/g.42814 Transcript_33215/m.42814 type:complete len:215 (-) Transcript_33215:255-899(-)